MRWISGWLFILLVAASVSPAAGQPAALVAVTKVFEKDVAPTALLVGNVVFDQSARISSEISGLIAGHQLVEGAVVRRGDVLVRLNSDFIIKDMRVLEQQIARIDIKIENTRKNLRRFETLYKEDAASEKSYDDLAFEAKELQVEKEGLRVSLAKKKLEIKKSVIRAPFDGLVLKRHINQGEWVAPGDAVCLLASVDDVVVQVALAEELMPFVKLGQRLSPSVPAMAKEFQGKIKAIVPDVDVKSKTFDIKIGIVYEPGLFQNMSAQVNVPTGPVRRLKMIKRDALVRFQGKEFVYTVNEGRAKILPIEVAAVDGEYLGVDAPHIVDGMVVVIDGNERLRPDQAVTIVEEPGKQGAPEQDKRK